MSNLAVPAHLREAGTFGVLSEQLWHAVTVDDTIDALSQSHAEELRAVMVRHGVALAGARVLEVGSYAHYSGYLLARDGAAEVTLSDCSADSLRLGYRLAQEKGGDVDNARRVVLDFHDLPFASNEFDVVFIASSLHHTRQWTIVLEELIRVTRPGGLFILLNEPTRRDFCLYKFETNRPAEFTPLETALNEAGVLATIAQPYFGSRPESLFGMIENQEMELDSMMAIVTDSCTIEEMDLDSSVTMSSLDSEFLARSSDQESLVIYAQDRLRAGVAAAAAAQRPSDVAMGKLLPSGQEIDELVERLALGLSRLPEVDGDARSQGLARLFGAAVRIVARKTKRSPGRATGLEAAVMADRGRDPLEGFSPKMAEMASPASNLLPRLQAATPAEVAEAFDPGEWIHSGTESNPRFVSLSASSGSIRLRGVPSEGECVVLLRVWGSPIEHPFRVALYAGTFRVAFMDVYQTESFLLGGVVPVGKLASGLTLAVEDVPGGSANTRVPPVSVGAGRVTLLRF